MIPTIPVPMSPPEIPLLQTCKLHAILIVSLFFLPSLFLIAFFFFLSVFLFFPVLCILLSIFFLSAIVSWIPVKLLAKTCLDFFLDREVHGQNFQKDEIPVENTPVSLEIDQDEVPAIDDSDFDEQEIEEEEEEAREKETRRDDKNLYVHRALAPVETLKYDHSAVGTPHKHHPFKELLTFWRKQESWDYEATR